MERPPVQRDAMLGHVASWGDRFPHERYFGANRPPLSIRPSPRGGRHLRFSPASPISRPVRQTPLEAARKLAA